MSTQHSLGNDQYPKTITEANSVLSSHKFDATYKSSNSNNNKKSEGNNKGNTQDSSKSDKQGEELNLSFAQMEGKCYCCGKGGHKSPQCRHKDKPKDQWAINKAKTNEGAVLIQTSDGAVLLQLPPLLPTATTVHLVGLGPTFNSFRIRI